MFLSDVRGTAQAETVRKPRPYVTINGAPLSGVLEAEVTNGSHFNADTYRVVCAISGLPREMNAYWWSTITEAKIQIFVGFHGPDNVLLEKAPLLTGAVDQIDLDILRGTLTLTGRDLSGPIIDTPTAEKFQNLTSSEIAKTIAARHGLTPNVIDTKTKAGVFYKIDHVLLTKDQSEWDLLVYLAQQESFDLWVSGTTLNFVPSIALTIAEPYVLLYSNTGDGNRYGNFIDLKLHRSLVLAQDVKVMVKSWHQATQKPYQFEWTGSPTGHKTKTKGKQQIYSFVKANLTKDQVEQFAKARYEEIVKHEMVLTADVPGDNILSTRMPVRLAGSDTAWDQIFYPEYVTRTLSIQDGYHMNVKAKNHSVQSQVNL